MKKNASKYVVLVDKFDKESKGEAAVIAEINAEVHESELTAMIAHLEAKKLRASNAIKLAEKNLEKTYAHQTDNTENWIDNSEVAEDKLEAAKKNLAKIEKSIARHENWVTIFQPKSAK